MSDMAVRRFADAFKDETIKIYVGEDGVTSDPYKVPKGILCKYRYFRKALSPPFVESQTGVLRFPEDTEEAWSILLYYFFRGEVQWSDTTLSSQTNLINLTSAYVLADKYELPALQNKIIKRLIHGLTNNCSVTPANLEEAISLLPAGCPVRWVILEQVVEMVKARSGRYDWSDFEGIVRFPGVLPDLMTSFELYNKDDYFFPPYKYYAGDALPMKKYLVEQTRGPDDED